MLDTDTRSLRRLSRNHRRRQTPITPTARSLEREPPQEWCRRSTKCPQNHQAPTARSNPIQAPTLCAFAPSSPTQRRNDAITRLRTAKDNPLAQTHQILAQENRRSGRISARTAHAPNPRNQARVPTRTRLPRRQVPPPSYCPKNDAAHRQDATKAPRAPTARSNPFSYSNLCAIIPLPPPRLCVQPQCAIIPNAKTLSETKPLRLAAFAFIISMPSHPNRKPNRP